MKTLGRKKTHLGATLFAASQSKAWLLGILGHKVLWCLSDRIRVIRTDLRHGDVSGVHWCHTTARSYPRSEWNVLRLQFDHRALDAEGSFQNFQVHVVIFMVCIDAETQLLRCYFRVVSMGPRLSRRNPSYVEADYYKPKLIRDPDYFMNVRSGIARTSGIHELDILSNTSGISW